MSRLFRVFALLATVAFFAGPRSAAADTTLKWKFKPGTSFDQKVEQNMTMTMQLGNQPIVTKVNQLIDVDWIVNAVDADGNANITQQFTRMRMKISNATGVPIEIDSETDAAPAGPAAQLVAPIKALAKAKFTVKMSPTGDILEVEVSEETVAAMQKLPGIAALGSMFSKEGLTNMVKQGSQKLPNEVIAKGRSWTNDAVIDLPQVGKMTATTTMTYEGPEAVEGVELERVRLDVDTKIEAGANAAVTLKEQSAKGTLFFNANDGYLHHSSLQQNMTMQVKAGGNMIDQKMEQTISVVLTPATK